MTAILNKETIIDTVANSLTAEGIKLTKKDLATVYDKFLGTVREGLVGGYDVRLTGIGSLRTKMAAERRSRNVRTQEPIIVPARREVKFSAADDLKKAVAGTAVA